jgi:hypothetical protein
LKIKGNAIIKQLIKKRTENKRKCNHENEDQIIYIYKKIKTKWLGIKLKNKFQLEKY